MEEDDLEDMVEEMELEDEDVEARFREAVRTYEAPADIPIDLDL